MIGKRFANPHLHFVNAILCSNSFGGTGGPGAFVHVSLFIMCVRASRCLSANPVIPRRDFKTEPTLCAVDPFLCITHLLRKVALPPKASSDGAHLTCKDKNVSHQHAAHQHKHGSRNGPDVAEMQFLRGCQLGRFTDNRNRATGHSGGSRIHPRHDLKVGEKERTTSRTSIAHGSTSPKPMKNTQNETVNGPPRTNFSDSRTASTESSP